MLYVAKKSGAYEIDDQSFVVEQGVTTLTAGHPLVKARPNLFDVTGERTAADAEEPKPKPKSRRKSS